MITRSIQLITLPQALRTIAALGLIALATQACKNDGSSDPTPAANVNIGVRQDAKLGSLLTDAQGNTLYLFSKDVDGKSACSGGCADVWPIFYEKNKVFAAGLDSTQFGVITRADGKKQNTFKGWPLYRFAQDTKPGDVTGEAKNGFYVAKPDYTIMVADKGAGKYLVGMKSARALYTFANDADNLSNCKDGCLTVWPQFLAEPPVAPSTISSSLFGTITRPEGSKQSTFNKKPLYYFQSDVARGDAKGTVANNKFVLVVPGSN